MAGSRLSFVIALKFITENFNRQATRVKSQLYTLQRNFLALASAAGAGAIGLTNFVSRLVETAKKTSQASIALQNVSGSMKAYADNQQWIIALSKKYGVEVNALTLGFAKFKAAADISNMSLEDQRKIFESVSRATVAFGLSQEDQRGVFMALSQMMSKNKVMAEELRLQLAERMPVAIQAMAKAAGVTVNELDSLMKQGKVLSSEVLPKFADALTEMTPNVNLDNLNKSLVDLSNIFTDLTRKLDIEGKFKSIVDAVAGALRWLVENVQTAISAIEHIVILGVARFLNSSIATVVKNAQNANNAAVKTVEAFERAKARLLGAEKQFGAESKQYTKALESYKRAQSKVTREVILRDLAAKSAGWKAFTLSVRAGIASISASLKALLASNIITGIVLGFTELARVVYKSVSSARALKKEIAETESRIESTANDTEITNAKIAQENFNISKSLKTRETALAQINKILGTEYSLANMSKGVYEEINGKLRERIEILTKTKQLENAIEERAKAESTIEELSQKSTKQKVRRFLGFAWNTGGMLWNKGGLSFSEVKELDAARAVKARVDKWIEQNYEKTLSPNQSATTKSGGGGGAGAAKLPVITLTIDEDDVAATMEQLQDDIFRNEAEMMRQRVEAMRHRGQSILDSRRDTSGDWKLSPSEILEAEKIFQEDKVSRLIAFAEETGNDMGAAIQKSLMEATSLEEAIKAAEIAEAIKQTQAELSNAKMNLFEGVVDNVDGMVNAFSRLSDAMKENGSAWEILMAVFDVFKTTVTGVMETIEALSAIKNAEAAANAARASQNIAASQGEAIAAGTSSAAKLPFPANVAAISSIVATIMSVFAMIPKFAKGGVVGGTSTQGDKILARLNSGEGVLTAVGMQSLHDASNPNNARNIRVTGVLVGQGRTLKAIIDKEDKFRKLTK